MNDMGWLGYFVGKNEQLTALKFRNFTPPSDAGIMEVLEPFLRGVTNNKSITTLDFYNMDLSEEGKIFAMMCPFFENDNLDLFHIEECILDDEGSRLLALAIGRNKHKSLTSVTLMNNDITEEGLVGIVTSLSMHPYLQYLDLDGNRLHKNGCTALSTLLTCSTTELETLDLGNVDLDDEGIDALVPALKNCSDLKTLRMCGNPSITTRGWQKVATILESPNVSIKDLNIEENNINDEVLTLFAKSLVNNRTLVSFDFTSSTPITEKGLEVFAKLLFDTSSVNSTFLSNHTLRHVSTVATKFQATLQSLLELNRRQYNGRNNEKDIAMIKILQHHNDFDMMPFFEWEFKVLPLVINWIERTSSIPMPKDFEPNIGPRKLSCIYQFVRGMPVEYVEARLRRELEEIKAAEIQMEEEQQELTGKLLDLETKHRLSQKRKRSIMERLDQRL